MWRQAIEVYEKGAITQRELQLRIWKVLSEETIEDFFQNCPKDILEEMIVETNHAPRTDEEWDRALIFCLSTWVGPADTIKDRIKKQQDQDKRDWRNGVELIRRHLED